MVLTNGHAFVMNIEPAFANKDCAVDPSMLAIAWGFDYRCSLLAFDSLNVSSLISSPSHFAFSQRDHLRRGTDHRTESILQTNRRPRLLLTRSSRMNCELSLASLF